MKKDLRYLRYIFLHKWFVLQEGWALDVPMWNLLVHDWSKLTRKEWGPYREYFYAPKTAETKAAFDVAWLLHIHRNPHHWNFWIVSDDKPKALPMPEKYVREMIADWRSVARVLKTAGAEQWYMKNRNRIILHEETRKLVEKLLDLDALKIYPMPLLDLDALKTLRTRTLDDISYKILDRRQRAAA